MMIDRFINRLLGRRDRVRLVLLRREPSPTDWIYVERPLRALARQGRLSLTCIDFDRGWSAKRLLACDVLIVSRYIHPEIIDVLRRHPDPGRRLIYLFDDDLPMAAKTDSLHEAYRRWIMPFAEGPFMQLLELADRLVVSSQHLMERYQSAKTLLLEPVLYLERPPGDPLKHFAAAAPLQVAYLGTTTHKYDLQAIAPALERLVTGQPRIQLTLVGCEPPAGLAGRPNVKWLPQKKWKDYCRFAARFRTHLSLAPLLDTPWNRGKSFIKLIEAAQFGAVPVCSNVAPYHALVRNGQDGFLVENDPEAWFACLKDQLNQADGLREIAARNLQRMRERAAPARAEQFWSQLVLHGGQ